MSAQVSERELAAAVLTAIHLGIAMARAAGVQCGSPQNIRIYPPAKSEPTKE